MKSGILLLKNNFLFSLFVAIITYFSFTLCIEKKLFEYKSGYNFLRYDAIEYYQYLPAIIIYGKPDFRIDLPKNHEHKFWVKQHKVTGKIYGRMSLGWAMVAAPGFVLGHVATKLTGEIPDGYSFWYLFFTYSWILFLVFAACRKLFLLGMQFHFPRWLIFLGLLGFVFASNLFCFISYDSFGVHAICFCLCAFFYYYLIQIIIHKNISLSNIFYASLSFVLLVITRPTNVVLILLPILYIAFSKEIRKVLIDYIKLNYFKILLVLLASLLPLLLQMMYWKSISGKYLFFSYENESFFWNRPMIFHYLFSFRKGWFIYCPIMFFSILGLFFFKEKKKLFLFTGIVLLLIIYIHSCWWCWWFGGCFGARSMIDLYPIVFLPFLAFSHYVFRQKIWIRFAYMLLLVFFMRLGFIQNKQYINGVLHWDSMSWKAYQRLFYNRHPGEDFNTLLNPPKEAEAVRGEYCP